jgi:hypothetical protein
LKHEFPEIKGFSRRNVYAILQWYKFYSVKYPFVPRDAAQIPWEHNRLILLLARTFAFNPIHIVISTLSLNYGCSSAISFA